MIKKSLFCLTLLLSSAAFAKDMATANALFAKKAYPEATQIYTKLANSGNVDAQAKLGEMALYGEGGPVDLIKADSWFKKAAAKGNKFAVGALEMMKQRELRRTDMDYWMSKYDGAELRTGQFRCAAPRIPTMSKQNEEIEAVAAKVEVWQTCYNNFVKNLNAATPLTKQIPKDIADLYTKDEAEKARLHLEEVYSRLSQDAKVAAKLVLADYSAWRDATDLYVAEHNRIVKDAATVPRKQD